MKKSIHFLFTFSLILAACAAPQVTVTSEVTITLSPPTETPFPTLTPTPVAVNGIAEDADGNKLAYFDGEWVALPEFAKNQATDVDRVEVQKPGTKDQRIVALDAEDVELYELSINGKEWVEVEKELEVVMNLSPSEAFTNARDAWLDANPWVLESIDWDTFVTDRMSDTEGNPLGYGVLSEWRSDDGEQYVVKLGVVALGGYEHRKQDGGSTIYVGVFGIPLDDGKMALLFLPNNSSSGPAFNTRL